MLETKPRISQRIEILNDVMTGAARNGLVHNFTTNKTLSNSKITIDEHDLMHCASCSYLGLEFHPGLKNGIIEATNKFGSQFSISRSYLSIGLYKELEDNLRSIYKKPLLVTASTTLGHLAALPVIVNDGDAVILDMQVHASVQMAAQILKARNIAVTIIPHNSMDALETKIKTLQSKHEKVWYLADGVYSMYGDTAPLDKLENLLNKYESFHLYIDDAHGMGWTGTNGMGYVRSQIDHHDKMVLITSMNKALASAGGFIVLPNEAMKSKIQNCGGTLIFSGPIQPPMLGSALAATQILKSDEIIELQDNLKSRVDFTNQQLDTLNLLQFHRTETPVFFIPVGHNQITTRIIKNMKARGFYLNAAGYPAVSIKKSGIRFMINLNMSFDEIEQMLSILKEEYVLALEEAGSSLDQVSKIFRLTK